MTCHITGIVTSPDGTISANCTVSFERLGGIVSTVEQGGVTVRVPRIVSAQTDAEGALAIDLPAGDYHGTCFGDAWELHWEFLARVPDAPSESFANCIATAPEEAPADTPPSEASAVYVALAQAWAEGTAPGGPGTQSAQAWAEAAQAGEQAAGIEATAAAAASAAAAESRAAAELARDAAMLSGGVHASVADGLGATAEGAHFSVASEGARFATLYRHAAGGIAEEVASYPSSEALAARSFSGMRSVFGGNDFRDGAAGWAISGADAVSWAPEGAEVARSLSGQSFGAMMIYKDVPGAGVDLVAGHRYALYADFDAEGDVAASGIDTLGWRPFVLQSTPGSAMDALRVQVGNTGAPIRHRVARCFTAETSATRGNPYIEFASPRDESDQNLLTLSLKLTLRCFMLVDLGVAGEPAFDLSETEVAEALARLGAPYHPLPETAQAISFDAVRAVQTGYAQQAGQAARADLADMAEALRSPWAGKRVITLGHSLVSQVMWQPHLREMLSLEGHSVRGISGGTLQPKPGEGVTGMFSRDYMAGLANDLINFSDATAGNATTLGLSAGVRDRSAATIFWLGANDGVTDLANAGYQTLALDGAQIAGLAAKAAALSVGHFAGPAEGLAATQAGAYFTAPGTQPGFDILYEHRNTGSAEAREVYHVPQPEIAYSCDRIMTEAEQDEFEARNAADGAAAFLSAPLSTGYIVTYEGLWHTMIANYLAASGFDGVPDHRLFIVREPQAFWSFDGTLDWPQGHFERNAVHARVADRWGIPLIDLWGESGINLATRGWYLAVEAGGDLLIHLNDRGGRLCANRVATRMAQFPPLDPAGASDGAALALPLDASGLAPWQPDNTVTPG
ncbi:hypothetical protein BMI91_03925 [Thioclava sediminum]|uniref:Uncharacterized protein n=2 Tax=Thioclava TaxID=285107 RepID=A0ABX3N3T5_9RHOB|nr:hypothetical protein [Thioclava sediminum]OOY25565.1 hypothetical protein BMI91_03925 [Thioclava sediminum]